MTKRGQEYFNDLSTKEVMDKIKASTANAFVEIREDVNEESKKFIAIKDNIAETGKQLTNCSELLEDYVSPFEATVITNLR